jgi:GDP-mannose 6-dehydrogenase
MKVSVFGLGYVGCVTAACLTKDGHEVIGVDVVSSKVERLAAGQPTVVETGIDELIREGRTSGKLSATTDGVAAVLNSDASIICVGTPNNPDGSLDLTGVQQTAELIGRAMMEKTERHVVILRSTVPAGTCEGLMMEALHPSNPHACLFDSDLVIVPEFLREGTAIADYYDPPFVVVGSASGTPDHNAAVVEALFGGVTDHLEWLPFREAEMLKATCNAFHALKVAFANEVGALCASLSINGSALMAQLVKDRKLNISPVYLRPGLAFGGSCLPKDLRMLLATANRKGVDLPLLRSLLPSNDAHLKRAVDMIPKNGMRKIGLNGLAFKSGTDDLRESPIVLIAEYLIGKGYDLKIHDAGVESSRLNGANRDYMLKHIPHLSSRLTSTVDELLEHAEILLITRDGDQLMERAAELGKKPIIVDLRGRDRLTKRSSKMVSELKTNSFAGESASKSTARLKAPATNGAKGGRSVPALVAA